MRVRSQHAAHLCWLFPRWRRVWGENAGEDQVCGVEIRDGEKGLVEKPEISGGHLCERGSSWNSMGVTLAEISNNEGIRSLKYPLPISR